MLAFGIDGSDYNKKRGLGYWPLLAKNLLTADAARPFHFADEEGKQFLFKVICSWECLEHIPERMVPGFLENVHNNLAPDGFFIGSISRMPYEDQARGIVYHVTLKENGWWREQFENAGLSWLDIESSPWDYADFARGTGWGYLDSHTNYLKNPGDGLLFVARKRSA